MIILVNRLSMMITHITYRDYGMFSKDLLFNYDFILTPYFTFVNMILKNFLFVLEIETRAKYIHLSQVFLIPFDMRHAS